MKTLLSVVSVCFMLAFSSAVFANQAPHVLAKKSITTSQMENLYQYNKVNMSSKDEDNDNDYGDEDDNSQESNSNTQNQGSDGTQSYDNGNSDDQGYNESGTW